MAKYVRYNPVFAIDSMGDMAEVGQAACMADALKLVEQAAYRIRWSGIQEATSTDDEISVFGLVRNR